MEILIFLVSHWVKSHMPLECIAASFILETSDLLGSCAAVPVELVTFVSLFASRPRLNFVPWGRGLEVSHLNHLKQLGQNPSQAPPFAACWCFPVCFYLDFAFAMRKKARNLMGLMRRDLNPKNLWLSGTKTRIAGLCCWGTPTHTPPSRSLALGLQHELSLPP